ncbi:hypothetical protein N7532_007257 [Penicillium argentinense]|uniref:Uncharacterized protein n=1 Tax=Penicillium argentinense TaxID=1131581 RepID=A0A9W9K752_9EURO|nr:uncharacterized protein N7532_007257 [Penicillium argentinense]KAJ5094966.1 hypothetical protein N7532_007257 [Penicillium argentinense]
MWRHATSHSQTEQPLRLASLARFDPAKKPAWTRFLGYSMPCQVTSDTFSSSTRPPVHKRAPIIADRLCRQREWGKVQDAIAIPPHPRLSTPQISQRSISTGSLHLPAQTRQRALGTAPVSPKTAHAARTAGGLPDAKLWQALPKTRRRRTGRGPISLGSKAWWHLALGRV